MATLEERVAALEVSVFGSAKSSSDSSATTSGYSALSSDFYFEAPGRWLDVTIGAGQAQGRNFVPPAGWSGQIEIACGRLAGNETDRIKVRVLGTGGSIVYQDTEWMSLDGYNVRPSVTGPVTIEITAERYAHISVNCNHQ